MSNFINLSCNIENDIYTEYVYNTFDIQNRTVSEEKIKCPDLKPIFENKNINIGVIYGPSGSGKTSILKNSGLGTIIDINNLNINESSKALISNFSWLSPFEAAHTLMSMGLSSVPSWLRPFHLLSNGEQHRAILALIVSKPDNTILLIDEFTSVLDRDVAKTTAHVFQKYIKKYKKQVLLSTCHYDILEWLMPDFIFSPLNNASIEYTPFKKRPDIFLTIERTESSEWDLFKKHHYMDEKVPACCAFFLFKWNDKKIGIVAIIQQLSNQFNNGMRESRLVVLPEFQGLGLGYTISKITAAIYTNAGFRYFTKTIHPALGEKRNLNTLDWRPTSKNGKIRNDSNDDGAYWKLKERKSYCHEYIGEKMDGCNHFINKIAYFRTNGFPKSNLIKI